MTGCFSVAPASLHPPVMMGSVYRAALAHRLWQVIYYCCCCCHCSTSRLCIPVVATLSSKMSEPKYCWEWRTGEDLASFTVHPLTLGASLIAQVNNLLAMQETQVWSSGQEDSPEGNGYSLQYSCLENPRDGESQGQMILAGPRGHKG